MNRGLKILFAIGLAMLTLAGHVPTAAADSVGYTVKASLPSNQLNKQAGYFDLLTQPRAQQHLTIYISNTSNRQQSFNVSVTQAITNDNGVIDYSQLKPQLDQSLKVGIKDIFSRASNQKVTVPANARKQVTLTYTMPAKRLRGMILGGVYVEQVPGKTKKPTAHFTIQNAFAYAIGIELQESRQPVAPNLLLHQIQATQINRRNFVTANLQNPEPGIMQKLKINARVTKVGATQTLIRQQQSGLGMAPNSNFNFGIPWGTQNLPAGQYTLHLTAQAGKRDWQFTRNFTIANRTVKRMNKTVLTPTQQPNYWLYALLGLLIALLLAIIGYLWYRNRHQKSAK